MDTAVRLALAELNTEKDLGIEIEYRICQESTARAMQVEAPANGKIKVVVILYAHDLALFCFLIPTLQKAVS